MDGAEVALAAIGVLGTTLVGFIWLVKWVARTLGKDLQEHTKAAYRQADASKEQAKAARDLKESVDKGLEVSTELHTFMKNLNGKLAKATIQTVKEQKVEKQIVESHEGA